MFKKNTQHLQLPLTSHIDELPEKYQERLKNSWAGYFYSEFFCNLDETPFSVLYADIPSRPNVPVNVLIALAILKSENDWTDEEMMDHFHYDIQLRYALGYRRLGEGDFGMRTIYYFRERLSRYYQETGINIFIKAFEQVSDVQIEKYTVKTNLMRKDSTQVMSNIQKIGRVQLLVEVLQRVHRMLTEEEKEHYKEEYAPYLKGHAGQFVYRMKKSEIESKLEQIGILIQRLLDDLKPVHGDDPAYKILERVFREHYEVEQSKKGTKERRIIAKPNDKLSASSMQSPDDLEATYREKRGNKYYGYVTSVAETCNPENELQLITSIQTAPNNTDDSKLLMEALPNLKKRMKLDTIITDATYASSDTDELVQQLGITHIQTAIRGRKPDPNKLHLSEFEIKLDDDQKPIEITCPQGQMVSVEISKHKKAFVAHFSAEQCDSCPMVDRCPAKIGKHDQRYHLRITKEKALAAIRQKISNQFLEEGRNLRAAVESTVKSIRKPLSGGKLCVRGLFRVSCMMIGPAVMTNVRRIMRYSEGSESKKETDKTEKACQDTTFINFFHIGIIQNMFSLLSLNRSNCFVGF
jgi:hypothetical protein